jgi:hypothetical protein
LPAAARIVQAPSLKSRSSSTEPVQRLELVLPAARTVRADVLAIAGRIVRSQSSHPPARKIEDRQLDALPAGEFGTP